MRDTASKGNFCGCWTAKSHTRMPDGTSVWEYRGISLNTGEIVPLAAQEETSVFGERVIDRGDCLGELNFDGLVSDEEGVVLAEYRDGRFQRWGRYDPQYRCKECEWSRKGYLKDPKSILTRDKSDFWVRWYGLEEKSVGRMPTSTADEAGEYYFVHELGYEILVDGHGVFVPSYCDGEEHRDHPGCFSPPRDAPVQGLERMFLNGGWRWVEPRQ